MSVRISVLIVTLNAVGTLRRALESVIAQTHDGVELIVIDGGSTDGTVKILEDLQTDVDFWVSEPDRGVYHALNKAVAKASGEWIYVLGADDFLFDRQVLEKMAPHLAAAFPQFRIVYGREAFLNEQGGTILILGIPWSATKRRLRSYMSLAHQAVFHHRSLFATYGPFDESFQVAGDYEFLLRALKDHDALFVPDITVACYQFGGGSSLPENNHRVLKEWRRAQRKNGILFPRPRWLIAYLGVWVRQMLSLVLGETRGRAIFDGLRRLAGKPRFWTRV